MARGGSESRRPTGHPVSWAAPAPVHYCKRRSTLWTFWVGVFFRTRVVESTTCGRNRGRRTMKELAGQPGEQPFLHQDWTIAALMVLVAFTLRVPFRSQLAYHWDSAQFAL